MLIDELVYMKECVEGILKSINWNMKDIDPEDYIFLIEVNAMVINLNKRLEKKIGKINEN